MVVFPSREISALLLYSRPFPQIVEQPWPGQLCSNRLKRLEDGSAMLLSNLLLYCAGRCARSWQRCWSLNLTPRPEQCVSLTALLTRELRGLYSLHRPPTENVIVLQKQCTD